MTDFEINDDEVITLVHAAQRGKPQFRGVIVPEEDALAYAAWEHLGKPDPAQIYTDAGYEPTPEGFEERGETLLLAAGCVARATPALVFFSGAAEGLMDLRFATACAICSLLWAVFHWIRG